jgi:hypothetical protein
MTEEETNEEIQEKKETIEEDNSEEPTIEDNLDEDIEEQELTHDKKFKEFFQPEETKPLEPSRPITNLENIEQETFIENKKEESPTYDIFNPDYETIAEKSMRTNESYVVKPNFMEGQNIQMNKGLWESSQIEEKKNYEMIKPTLEGIKENKTHSPFEQQERKYEIR